MIGGVETGAGRQNLVHGIGVDATAAETATGTVATVIESGIPDATRAHLETPEGTEADHAARVAEIIGTDVCLLMLLPVL